MWRSGCWVSGKWSRAGVTNTQTRMSARGQVQGHDDLQIFSFALLFIYGKMNQRVLFSLRCHRTYRRLSVNKLLIHSSSYSSSKMVTSQPGEGWAKFQMGLAPHGVGVSAVCEKWSIFSHMLDGVELPAHFDVHQRMRVDGDWTKQQRLPESSGCLPCALLFLHSPPEMGKKHATTL